MEASVKISGVVITFNEEKNIRRCLESLQSVCDEIIVVDSFSTDKTKEICEQFKVRFVENAFEGYPQQKNFALEQASHDRVLSLDADEALDETLQQSILKIKTRWQHKAYRINRLNNFCGKWIKHSAWYPDARIRFWDKRVGRWSGTNVHESVIIDKKESVGSVRGDILHYSYISLGDHVSRSVKYTKIAAKAAHANGKKAKRINLWLNPSFKFFQYYVLRGGFLDGFYGLAICATTSYTTYLRYAFLWDLNRGKSID